MISPWIVKEIEKKKREAEQRLPLYIQENPLKERNPDGNSTEKEDSRRGYIIINI